MAGEVIKALHTGISVRNMAEAVEWYEKWLGFKQVEDLGFVPPLKAHLLFIEDKNGYQIELFEYENPKPTPEERLTPNSDLQTCGTKHLALAIDDADAFKEKFLAENGGVIAHEVNMGADHVLFILDPSGTIIELIQQPK